MAYRVAFKIFLVVLLGGQVANADPKDYNILFYEGPESCPNFQNNLLKADDVDVGLIESGVFGMCLEGTVEFLKPVVEGMFFSLEIGKYGKSSYKAEPFYSTTLDFCQTLKETEAPWYNAMQEIGLKECPINPGTYVLENFCLDKTGIDSFLNRDFVARYEAKVEILDSQKKSLSCYILEFEIESLI